MEPLSCYGKGLGATLLARGWTRKLLHAAKGFAYCPARIREDARCAKSRLSRGRSITIMPRPTANFRLDTPLVHFLPHSFPIHVQYSIERCPTKAIRYAFHIVVECYRLLVVIRRHSPLPTPAFRIHQKPPHVACIRTSVDDVLPLLIASQDSECSPLQSQ